jgi:acylphosphatase
MSRARVRIRGRVQGVFFRAEASQRARSLGLAGWVRNCPDGSVDWCRRGPSGAQVDGIDVKWEQAAGDAGFRVV